MDAVTANTAEVTATRAAPTSMKKRRPIRSTHCPITGWHTMPVALYMAWMTPISASVPPSWRMCRGSNTNAFSAKKKRKLTMVACAKAPPRTNSSAWITPVVRIRDFALDWPAT